MRFTSERHMSTQTHGTTSLLRALAILEMIAHKPGGFSNAEISRRLKIATSTTSYILGKLEQEGYIKRNCKRGRYEMSLKVVALAHGALREMGLRRAAEPILHRLAADTKCSGLIGVLERGLVMIVDKVEQPGLTKWDLEIGVRYPAHSTALGKVLLANLPDKELTDLFEKSALSKGAGQADSQLTGFRRELGTCKKQGYAMSVGGLFIGVWAVAAPIFDSLGQVRAAVSATSNAGQHSADDVIPYVTRSAKEISMRLVAGESIKLPRNGE